MSVLDKQFSWIRLCIGLLSLIIVAALIAMTFAEIPYPIVVVLILAPVAFVVAISNLAKMFFVTAFSIGLPIFLYINLGGLPIRLYVADEGSVTQQVLGTPPVPIGLLVVPAFLLMVHIQRVLARQQIVLASAHLYGGMLMFSVFAFLTFLIGQGMQGFSVSNFAYVAQLLFPFMGYAVAVESIRRREDIVTSINMIALAVFLICLGIVIQTTIDYGSPFNLPGTRSVHVGQVFIYQARVYFPLTTAYIASILLGLFVSIPGLTMRRSLLFVSTIGLGTIILSITWSKGALGVFLGSAIIFLLARIKRPNKKVLFVAGVGILLGLVLLQKAPIVVIRMIELLSGDWISLTSRFRYWTDGLEIFIQNPLVAAGFVAQYTTTVGAIRVFASHNQYLDIVVKGGLITLLPFAALLYQTIKVLLAGQRSPSLWARRYAWSVFVPTMFVILGSNMLQSNLTQPYSGILIWFMVGTVEMAYKLDLRQKTDSNQ